MPTPLARMGSPKLEFSWLTTYWNTRSFTLAGLNRGFHYTPRLAKPYQSTYIDRGCTTVNINPGYTGGPGSTPGRYTALAPANTSTFLGPEYIQDSLGGKHFVDFTLADARTAVNYAWNRAGGWGLMTSGAQEGRFDNDYWAQLASLSPTVYGYFAQAWGEKMAANPGFKAYDCYDGMFYLNVNESSATLKTALSSNANAHAYLMANVYGPNPYFRDELWRHKPPLLNLYFRAFTDLHLKMFEIRVATKLVRMALAHVGRNWPICLFMFPGNTEFVSYTGQGYTELVKRPLPGDGRYENYNFPDYAHVFQWDQTFTALEIGDDYYGWNDTLLGGDNLNLVLNDFTRGDGFPVRKRYGGTGITAAPMGPTPYNPASVYPCSPEHEGHSDLAPLGAEDYATVARYGGQASQNARFRTPGGAWCSLDSGYLVDRRDDRKPFVTYSRMGDVGWVKVSDYNSEPTGPYELQIDVGSNQYVVFLVEPQNKNLAMFNSSNLYSY